MNAAIFTVLIILSVIGITAIMNAAVKQLFKSECARELKIVFVGSGNFEMQIRGVSLHRTGDTAIICAIGLTSDEFDAAARLCAEKGVVFCDKSTLCGAVRMAADEVI